MTRRKLSFSTLERSIIRNTSESEEGVALVLPQEVQSLQAFDTLVLVQNHFQTPVVAKAAAWFDDEEMKTRVGMTVPPAVSGRRPPASEEPAAGTEEFQAVGEPESRSYCAGRR